MKHNAVSTQQTYYLALMNEHEKQRFSPEQTHSDKRRATQRIRCTRIFQTKLDDGDLIIRRQDTTEHHTAYFLGSPKNSCPNINLRELFKTYPQGFREYLWVVPVVMHWHYA